MRPKTKFLTVVWGKSYITRFAELALPSFIAPGNLPALADATDLEVVIMTRREDITKFEGHATFEKLRAICSVRFVEIDDLITTSVYGVTLTLAYARPIIACGTEMLNTHFVFMNADFVLADGSLRSLARHITDGRAIILGPSFRATAENVEPLLEDVMARSAGALAIPPRQMAALAMQHPHPTTVAKTLTQGLCHSTHPNQFFWQVDRDTLLARYYLIFMLCLKPERILESVNSFCDYSFIPEMCPSGDEAVMHDSDDFFMLELQQREQEIEMLRLGSQPAKKTASSLQVWTTKEHRRAATHDIIFHAGDVPASIGRAKTAAQAFISGIDGRLGPPVRHDRHPYWIRGERAWINYRTAQGLPSTPAELAAGTPWLKDIMTPGGLKYRIRKLVWTAAYSSHRSFVSRKTLLSLFNVDYLDLRLLQDTLAKASRKKAGRPILVVRDKSELIDHLVAPGSGIELMTVADWLSQLRNETDGNAGAGRDVFIHLAPNPALDLAILAKRCQTVVDGGGECHLLIQERSDPSRGARLDEGLLQLIGAFREISNSAVNFQFSGGRLKRFHRNFLSLLGKSLVASGTPSLLWIIPLLTIEVPAILISNLVLRRKYPSRKFIKSCSSIAIHVSPIR